MVELYLVFINVQKKSNNAKRQARRSHITTLLFLFNFTECGISAFSVGIGCARADTVSTVERHGLFLHVCVRVCVDFPPRTAQCHKA